MQDSNSENDSPRQPQKQENFLTPYLKQDFSPLISAILFICQKCPRPLSRVSLCKMLYYADGHFFQKYAKTISGCDYLHVEGSPQPVFFNEILQEMIAKKQMTIVPEIKQKVTKEGMISVLNGLIYKPLCESFYAFKKEEEKVLLSVVKTFQGDLSLETRHYPNLYQQYVQTGLCQKIIWQPLQEGKPHLSWKGWSSRIFRLWGQ